MSHPTRDPERAAVLLVDDDEGVRTFAATALTAEGYDVVQAANGDAALSLLAAGRRFSVLITDIRMPGIDGWELAMRAREIQPDLGVIYVTAFSPGELRAVQGAHYLHKPYGPKLLAQMVRDLAGPGAEKRT